MSDHPFDAPLRGRRAAAVARASLTYVFDAQCPWCHAVNATVRAVAAQRPELPLDILHGRLLGRAALGDVVWYAPTASSVRGLTGAPFGPAFEQAVAARVLVGDSEATAAAFVAMRSIAPDLALDIAAALHSALFVNGRDITDLDTVLDVAASVGLSPDRVWAMLGNPLVGRLAAAEQARVAASALQSYPGLLVHVGDRDVPIATRLRSLEQVLDAIDGVLDRFARREV